MKLLECVVTQGGGHSDSSFDLEPINIVMREWHTTVLLSSLSSQLQRPHPLLLTTPAKALRTSTMASEQPTDSATPSVFVHPPSPAAAEPIDITNDIAEEARTFKPYLRHFDRIDPSLGSDRNWHTRISLRSRDRAPDTSRRAVSIRPNCRFLASLPPPSHGGCSTLQPSHWCKAETQQQRSSRTRTSPNESGATRKTVSNEPRGMIVSKKTF
jgi:hypothetical protein